MIGGGGLVALEHLQARLIAVDERRLEQVLAHQVDQRHDVLRAQTDHPAGLRCPPKTDPEPIELALLAIQRDAIDELRRHDVRQQ